MITVTNINTNEIKEYTVASFGDVFMMWSSEKQQSFRKLNNI